MMQLDGSIAQDRIHMIQSGITPRAIEEAYRTRCVRQMAREKGVAHVQLAAAAQAWGIENPRRL